MDPIELTDGEQQILVVNLWLYQRRAQEVELHQQHVEAGRVRRYLYHVRL